MRLTLLDAFSMIVMPIIMVGMPKGPGKGKRMMPSKKMISPKLTSKERMIIKPKNLS